MEPNTRGNEQAAVLLVSVLIISTCAILYELLIGTLTTYFLGSSILHFSVVIGLFLFAMGVGSWLSRYFTKRLLEVFINAEIALSVAGGFAAFILYYAFALSESYYIIAGLLVFILGALVGLEIPLITRILRKYGSLRDVIAKVLSFDYLGALVASLIFPLLLLPHLGTMRTAFIVGVLNAAVAVANILFFKDRLQAYKPRLIAALGVVAVLLAGFLYSLKITALFESKLYQDQIVYSKQTPYQRIVLTQYGKDVRLFLNGNLQFCSLDEYRYHEPLVHLPIMLCGRPESVLILGGGDGLALREVLKYKEVKHVTLVDLDKAVTELGSRYPMLQDLNRNAFADQRVEVLNMDAFNFLKDSAGLYSVVIIDLPDPGNHDISKLYTEQFYRLVKKRLSADGMMITQSTSPYFASKAFWSIHKSVAGVFGHALPLNVYVPSFGNWGFNLASNALNTSDTAAADILTQKLEKALPQAPAGLRYLSPTTLKEMTLFGPDMLDSAGVEPNTIARHKLVDYYEQSWHQWE